MGQRTPYLAAGAVAPFLALLGAVPALPAALGTERALLSDTKRCHLQLPQLRKLPLP